MSTQATSTTLLYRALKQCGFTLPDECGDVQMLMPVDGVFQLHYTVNLTHDDMVKIGNALIAIGLKQV